MKGCLPPERIISGVRTLSMLGDSHENELQGNTDWL